MLSPLFNEGIGMCWSHDALGIDGSVDAAKIVRGGGRSEVLLINGKRAKAKSEAHKDVTRNSKASSKCYDISFCPSHLLPRFKKMKDV